MSYDFHIHLARLPDPERLAAELSARAYRYNAVACEPWEWEKLSKIWDTAHAQGQTEGCNVAYGLHPSVAGQACPEDFERLARLLDGKPTAQVGECGIDRRFPGYGADGIQEEVFRRQASLALSLRRDLQVHCVGDYGRILRILTEVGFRHSAQRVIFHRFGADVGVVRAARDFNAVFSLHKSSFQKKSTVQSLPSMPEGSVVYETDADESFVEALRGAGNPSASQAPGTADKFTTSATAVAEALIQQLDATIRLR